MYIAYVMEMLIKKAHVTVEDAWYMMFFDTEGAFKSNNNLGKIIEEIVGVKSLICMYDYYLLSKEEGDKGCFSVSGGTNYKQDMYPIGIYEHEESRQIGGKYQFKMAFIVR